MSTLAATPDLPGPAEPGRVAALAGARRRTWPFWLLGLLVVLGLGELLAVVGHAKPAYDASGWLVWSYQVLHGSLNLDGAPSWKPLPFLFTLPFGLTGHVAAMRLWIIVACAAGVGAPLLAGRLAWRLAPRSGPGLPAWLGPALATVLATGLAASMTVAAKSTPVAMGYLRQVLIVTADPLITVCWLLAIDRHLSRRYGWALALLFLAGLGRPEAWPFLGLYGIFLWRRVPGMTKWVILAILATGVAWFLAPGLCSKSLFSAGNLDLNQPTAIHGSKIIGVLQRVYGLSGRDPDLEVAASIVLAALVRDRRTLGLVALAATWTVVEIVFALHGWSAVERYLMEAGALLAVVGGVGVAHLIALPGRLAGRGAAARPRRVALQALAGILVVGVGVGLSPFTRASVRAARAVVANQQLNTADYNALTALVHKAGGPRAITACGQPDATVGWQAEFAWETNLDVGTVLFRPSNEVPTATVNFDRTGPTSWELEVVHPPPGTNCSHLDGLSS